MLFVDVIGIGMPILVIPWIVIQELDSLKVKKNGAMILKTVETLTSYSNVFVFHFCRKIDGNVTKVVTSRTEWIF